MSSIKIKHGNATQVVRPIRHATEEEYKKHVERRAKKEGRTASADALKPVVPVQLQIKGQPVRVRNKRVETTGMIGPGRAEISQTEKNRRKRERRKRRGKS